MRPLVSLISVAAFLLHMSLGCCAHHSHAGEEGLCAFRSIPTQTVADHGHTHGHDHSTPESEVPQQPKDSHDDCHESHCSFLVSGKMTVDPDTLETALPPLALDAVVAQSAAISPGWKRDTGNHLRLSVRLHLFNQVLLI